MTIRNGQSATDHIDPGETLAVTPGAGASVALRQRNSDGSTTFITTVVGATYSIGPFTTTREYVMECAGGTAEYSIFVAPASQGSGGSGAPYLGPQTWATLRGGSVADGTPGLLALAKDTVVYITDRLAPYVPNAAGTAWTVGSAGEVHSVADLAARQTAGDPVPINTLLIDPATDLMYGQSDGAGSYKTLLGSDTITVSVAGAGDVTVEV